MIEEGFEVRVLKLVSGEEILAYTKEVTDDVILLKHPFSLIMTPDGKIASIPFMIYADLSEGVTMHRDHVMMVVTPKQDLVDSYVGSMSTILTPNKRIVLS